MNNLNIISGNSFEEIYINTNEYCKSGEVYNLIFNARLPISEIHSPFIELYIDDAKKWHEPECPPDLIFNHGQYSSRPTDSDEYLIKELKTKRYSNRAFVSLLNMEDIIGSNDDPRPSLLTIQFGFNKTKTNTIYVSANYRSQEVSNFLKINLAEIALYLRKIKEEFYEIEFFHLYVYTFRAQLINNFHCLKKCTIDTMTSAQISFLVFKKNKERIIELLLEKSSVEESLINYDCFKHLYNSFMELDDNPKMILKVIERIIKIKTKLKKRRETSSNYYEDILPISTDLSKSYSDLIEEVGNWK